MLQSIGMLKEDDAPDILPPDHHKNRLFLKLESQDVDFFRDKVWREFFETADIPRSLEQEWASVLSDRRMPDSGLDLGLTFALA
jgi:hypothetical protein